MPDENPVLVNREAGWAEVILNRPERRNSVIAPLNDALREALLELDKDTTISSIILRGEDGYFCSGIDLKALQADPAPTWLARQGPSWRELHLALFNLETPVIGAFESYGINAGAALALACDLLIAGQSAFIQIGEIQQGVAAPMNAAWLKIKSSEQVAARLVLYGDRVSAPEMLRLGLATECVEDSEVVDRCRAIAKRLAEFPEGATGNLKRSLIAQRGISDPEQFFPTASGPGLKNAGMVK